MTPLSEKNMRANIAEYTQGELCDLAIKLQNTINEHMAEKTGQQAAVDQMSRQNEALLEENERMEALTEGVDQVDSQEVERLQAEVFELREINTGLQKTIVKLNQ